MELLLLVACLPLATSHVISKEAEHRGAFQSRDGIFYETLENAQFWNAEAQNELEFALGNNFNEKVAKNVILFIGDGMGIPTVTAARIYHGQQNGGQGERNSLSFENFPFFGSSKTYNVDFQVPDSAGTATALLSGSKTSKGVVGVDARVTQGECEAMTEDTLLENLIEWSQREGKRTGIVTSTRVTHATPASCYAHSPDRDWECDEFLPPDVAERCPSVKDIASQLVDNEPGRSLNVILGGGFQYLDGDAVDMPGDDLSSGCKRQDGRKLWKEWLDAKEDQGLSAAFVRNRTDLLSVDVTSTDYLMGIFANSHLPFEYEKESPEYDFPKLSEMTEVAIRLLSQEPNGFFLMVESGRIDHGHHDTMARKALDETVALHETVNVARSLLGDDETLFVVTADHSHTMSISGYPFRGASILGTSLPALDLKFYTTLSYANGPGYNYTVGRLGTVQRPNPRDYDTEAFDYEQLAAVPVQWETHGGEDVAIYALGPMAHLMEGIHEQNYIAHAIAYASCVGYNMHHCS